MDLDIVDYTPSPQLLVPLRHLDGGPENRVSLFALRFYTFASPCVGCVREGETSKDASAGLEIPVKVADKLIALSAQSPTLALNCSSTPRSLCLITFAGVHHYAVMFFGFHSTDKPEQRGRRLLCVNVLCAVTTRILSRYCRRREITPNGYPAHLLLSIPKLSLRIYPIFVRIKRKWFFLLCTDSSNSLTRNAPTGINEEPAKGSLSSTPSSAQLSAPPP